MYWVGIWKGRGKFERIPGRGVRGCVCSGEEGWILVPGKGVRDVCVFERKKMDWNLILSQIQSIDGIIILISQWEKKKETILIEKISCCCPFIRADPEYWWYNHFDSQWEKEKETILFEKISCCCPFIRADHTIWNWHTIAGLELKSTAVHLPPPHPLHCSLSSLTPALALFSLVPGLELQLAPSERKY